ncbi:AraC family transcriptional regulator [Curtobacterium flaccumfaciens pv. flaccumfaciens]|uniref:AraC family transcriptional regulator n=1 Tax=Curtobacterium flaccumfaciens TaxID=2035 RepID=UPI001BDF48C9|nr:AraC family transcriptional regulator [Curtobacterium flaccumfaciens]MBT1667752.1 AraC family transcriptional regulator [Curtobacterium flaccumfaciens pv. flaccumfaciens]
MNDDTEQPARIRVDEQGTDLAAAKQTLATAYDGIEWHADTTGDGFDYRYTAAGDGTMTLRAVHFGGRLTGEMPAGDDFVVQWITRGLGVLGDGGTAIHLVPGRPQMWPNEAFPFRFEDYDQRLVQVNRTAVEGVAAERGLSLRRFDHTAQIDDAAIRQWRQTVQLISATTLDRQASPLLQAEMGRLAAVSLLELYPRATADLPPELLLPQHRRIRQVVEYVHEHAHLPITSTDLARMAHLSLRALQAAFQRLLGMSPNAYIRSVRLDRIRAELLASDPATTNVADVARYWGFAHAGRFSAAYADRHGEYPSETLRRS